MRRALIIVSIIVVLIGLAVGAYFLFFSHPGKLVVDTNTFGTDGTTVTPVTTTGEGTVTQAGAEIGPHLLKITDGPVSAGAVAFTISIISTSTQPSISTTTATTTTTTVTHDTDVRYIDRASGNIYQFQVHARTLSRLSNRTLPGIQEASWLSNGSLAYARFLSRAADNVEHIETYSLPATGEGGSFLEEDLDQASVYGTSTLFSLLSSQNGSIGSISKADGSNARTLFSSTLTSLVVHPSAGTFVANTRASAGLNGYGFAINPSTGAFTHILGPLRGLTTLPSPSGKLALYTYTDQGALHMAIINTETHVATALPLATITEKCAWSSDSATIFCGVPRTISGTFPDDWYQGAVTTSDKLWRISLGDRVATLVVDPSQSGDVDIDMANLTVDPANDVVVFRNRVDSSLWSYDL